MCNIISQVFTCCGHKQFQNIYQCDFNTSTMIASSCSSSFPRVLPDRLPPRQQEEYPLRRHHQTSKHEGKEGKDLAAIAGIMPAGSATTKTGTQRRVLQQNSSSSSSSSSSSESSPPASEAETQTGRPCPNLRRPSRPVGGFCGNCIRRRRLLRLHGGSGGSCLSVGGRLGLGDLPNLPRVVLDLPSSGAGSAAVAAFYSVSVINEDREGEFEVGRASVIREEGREGGTVRRKERERERGMGSVSSTTGSSEHASSGSSATLFMGASSAAVGGASGGQAVLHGQGIGIAI
ncbi:hypothetical protein QBC37DRAFT_397962 [Rhypophila decipiens]|uniref:Uncharacterized protein n=1 Tax=Rhypophila decipiens TaxID=261697 RepID=A0AAN6YBG0_9PEZI|nr:hypothetical protein QBC37DRAFT_397962 [Rhypophila decipiens]